MELLFAYLAGVLTLINPCVLPVLPLVLGSAIGSHRLGPVAMAAGMSLSFVVFGVAVTAFGGAIGLTQETLAKIGAAMMVGFGVILLAPTLAHRFEAATAGVSARADAGITAQDTPGLRGQFIGGLLLGTVWSPCIGPTLGGAIALASQGQNLGWVTAIMVGFAAGVSTFVIGLGMGTAGAIRARAQRFRGLAERSKPILGVAFIVIGAALMFNLHHVVEGWLVRVLPFWLQDLSVKF